MYSMKNKLLVISIVLMWSCSSNPKIDNDISQFTVIQKPELSYRVNNLPKSIKVYYFQEESYEGLPSEIEGFLVNSYFYQSNLSYRPNIEIHKLDNRDCNLSNDTKGLVILFNISFQNDLNKLECIKKFSKSNTFYISNSFNLGFNNNFIVDQSTEKQILISRIPDNLKKFVFFDTEIQGDETSMELLKEAKKEVIIQSTYSTKKNTQNLMSEILMSDRSDERKRKLSRRLSKTLTGDPRTREDIDSFFLSVNIEEARIIKPALDFISEKDFDVYILNNWRKDIAYELADKDLIDTINSDLPIMMPIILPQHIPPEKRSRRFGIGYDTFEIVLLRYGAVNTRNYLYKGLTGKIDVNRSGVRRSAYVFKLIEDGIDIL